MQQPNDLVALVKASAAGSFREPAGPNDGWFTFLGTLAFSLLACGGRTLEACVPRALESSKRDSSAARRLLTGNYRK